MSNLSYDEEALSCEYNKCEYCPKIDCELTSSRNEEIAIIDKEINYYLNQIVIFEDDINNYYNVLTDIRDGKYDGQVNVFGNLIKVPSDVVNGLDIEVIRSNIKNCNDKISYLRLKQYKLEKQL